MENQKIKMNGEHTEALEVSIEELQNTLFDINGLGMQAFPDADSEGAQRIEEAYLKIREGMELLEDLAKEVKSEEE